MFADFEEKGKIFTQVVTKEPVEVIIQTTTVQIHGQVHVKLDDRLKDELDKTPGFLAVTNATILPDNPNSSPISTNFMAVNVNHIIWISPQADMESSEISEA
jgi:hypothetical protein